jgi:hypothetical protein
VNAIDKSFKHRSARQRGRQQGISGNEKEIKMSTLEKALPKPNIELYSGKYFAACGLGGIIGRFSPSHYGTLGSFKRNTYQLDLSKSICLFISLKYPYILLIKS